MPARIEYPGSQNLMNWFFDDFDKGFGHSSLPLSNIVETKEDYRIEISVPGYSKNDFKVKLDGQILNISGGNEDYKETSDERYVRHEFSVTSFNRSFRLSNWIDSASITAKYENGILSVTIPKNEELKSKSVKEIEID